MNKLVVALLVGLLLLPSVSFAQTTESRVTALEREVKELKAQIVKLLGKSSKNEKSESKVEIRSAQIEKLKKALKKNEQTYEDLQDSLAKYGCNESRRKGSVGAQVQKQKCDPIKQKIEDLAEERSSLQQNLGGLETNLYL